MNLKHILPAGLALTLLLSTSSVYAATPVCNSPHLSYFGGRVLANVKIVPVFYGTAVNAQLTNSTTGISRFYADVTQSSYWTLLCQYDTPSQHIGPGTATAGITIQPLHISYGGPFQVSDAQIQSELERQVALGVLPAPDSNTLYMISFPANANVTGPSEVGYSCVDFCAYHNSFMAGGSTAVYCYAVLMDNFTGGCATGCASDATAMQVATDIASHELTESVTDPDIGLVITSSYSYPAAWADGNNNCGEIADICAAGAAGDVITVSGRSWVVQEIWSDCQNRCASSGPAPKASNLNYLNYQNTAIPITLSLANPTIFCHYKIFKVTTSPAHGTLSGTAPNLTYTPANDYLGVDTFRYTANGSAPSTVAITIIPFAIVSSSLDQTKTSFTVCWQSVPGVIYSVMTNSILAAPGAWVSAGSTNATGTTTCFTLPGSNSGKPNLFVVIRR